MSYHLPQTPQSPSQNSPATTDPVSSMNTSMSSFTTALPTPAHSINGTTLPSEATNDVSMTGEFSQKRKRDQGDHGGQAREKRVHIDESPTPAFEALHEDVGEKYLVGQKTWVPSLPCLTDDLFDIYDLTDIAADVARVRPDGVKNSLRKTYKGQIKKFDLTGHFDAVKREYHDRDSILQMLDLPEDVWEVNLVKGKEIGDGFSSTTKQALPRAMTMARGPISKDRWDSSVLAEFAGDKPGKSSKPTATAPGTPRNPALSNVLPRVKVHGAVSKDGSRGLRQKPKRSYHDSSFDGYDFIDDDTGLDTGYSTGEGENKKRGKKSAAVSRIGTPRQAYHGGPGNLGA